MIRCAGNCDREAILRIWQTCFGDSESYISFFLNNGFHPDSCLLWEENGKPVAMLHLLYADYQTNEKRCPVQYIYAAATLPAFQGRGIMGHMVDYAVKKGAEQGLLFTYLLPGSKGLYNYYAKLKFETAFSLQKAQVSREELKKTVSLNETEKFEKPNPDDIYTQRQKEFCPAVLWQRETFGYVVSEWQFTGGDVLQGSGCYAFCRVRDNEVEVRESAGEFGRVAAMLLAHYEAERFTFYFPQNQAVPFPAEVLPYGMLKPCRNDFSVQNVAAVKPYTNLMLE